MTFLKTISVGFGADEIKSFIIVTLHSPTSFQFL